MAGFTAVRYVYLFSCYVPKYITCDRDLGTEGAGDADVHLRDCMSSPKSLMVGPRYFIANRAIVSTGSYGKKDGL